MVTQKDIYGQTPLHHAVINRNIQAISSLASKGVRDLFFKYGFFLTPKFIQRLGIRSWVRLGLG